MGSEQKLKKSSGAGRPRLTLMYRGETVWFHSINSNHDVVLIYDYLERLLQLNRFVPPQEPLSRKVFQRYVTDALF